MKFHDLGRWGGGRGLFNLAKTIVSVLHELERRIKYKSELPAGE